MENTPTNIMIGSRHIDRTGEKIGYITILGLSNDFYICPTTRKRGLKFNFKCDCGNIGSFNTINYNKRKKSKIKTSCGCNMGGLRDNLLLNKSGYNTCYICKEIKPISEFGKNKLNKNGLQKCCKTCKSNTDKIYRNDPRFRERILENKQKEYTILRNDPVKWEKYLERGREIRDYVKEYKQNQTDPFRRSKSAIRRLIHSSLKVRNVKKSKLCLRSEDILGCSFDFFKKYIETQFQQGMSWNNHGDWHLDHKVPLDSATTIEELIKLNHWSNFQPLWANENLKKTNILSDEHLELYNSLIK